MEIYEEEESEINFWWKDTYYWLMSSSIFIYVPLGITPIFQELSVGGGVAMGGKLKEQFLCVEN